MEQGILTLLSDFGLSDPYVGVMKGTIAHINPHLTVIDLTHQIPAQNIAAARFALMTSYSYFPDRTVHVAVVDPGVGSTRRGIALAIGSDPTQPVAFLVGPDNGLFSGVLQQQPILQAVDLTNPQYWRIPNPSKTFHGRDIFAAVGAHLASDVPLTAVGTLIAPETIVQLPIPDCVYTQKFGQTVIRGCIQAVDHFGNLITNIPATAVANQKWCAIANGLTIASGQTYSDRSPGELIALIGSHEWVELAVSNGNAQTQLNLNWGDAIEIVLTPEV